MSPKINPINKAAIYPKQAILSGVQSGIYNNVDIFASPPVTEAAFELVRADFANAAQEFKLYGITKKTAFLVAKKNSIDQLDQMASYVDEEADGDVSKIAVAGFIPSKAQFQRTPAIEKVESFIAGGNRVSGEVDIEMSVISNRGAVSYSCICSEGGPLKSAQFVNGQMKFESDGIIHQDCTKGRKKTIRSLPSGTKCYFYVYATNSAGVSPLSDPRSVWIS